MDLYQSTNPPVISPTNSHQFLCTPMCIYRDGSNNMIYLHVLCKDNYIGSYTVNAHIGNHNETKTRILKWYQFSYENEKIRAYYVF